MAEQLRMRRLPRPLIKELKMLDSPGTNIVLLLLQWVQLLYADPNIICAQSFIDSSNVMKSFLPSSFKSSMARDLASVSVHKSFGSSGMLLGHLRVGYALRRISRILLQLYGSA